MRPLIVTLLLFLSLPAFSQKYIDKTRGHIKRMLEDYAQDGNYTLELSDPTNFLVSGDSVHRKHDLIIHFDASGRCDRETNVFDCLECFQQWWRGATSSRGRGWRQANDSQYISRYPLKVVLEISTERPYTYVIRRINREEYWNIRSPGTR